MRNDKWQIVRAFGGLEESWISEAGPKYANDALGKFCPIVGGDGGSKDESIKV